MKKTIRLMSFLVVVITALCCILSCSKDSDEATSGKWYLVSYGSSNVECTWGEYLSFSGNAMTWGARDRGSKNSYFTYTCSGKNIVCIDQNGSEDIIFTIESVSGSKMTTTSTDGIKRKWRR